MNCEQLAITLLEADSALPPQQADHTASCPRCRALWAAHQEARSLGQLEAVPQLVLPDPAPLVARRRRVRWGGALAVGAAGLLAALLVTGVPGPANLPLALEEEGSEGLLALFAHLDDLLLDQLPHDPAYEAAFGELPRWLAPPEGAETLELSGPHDSDSDLEDEP